jgi:hypothetical protein
VRQPLWRFISAAISYGLSRGSALRSVSAIFLLLCLATSAARAQNARVTQIDTTSFPHIRVYLSLTDQNGNPISTTETVTLKLFEDGRPVKEEVLSDGGISEGYAVLALDLSDSMRGDKLIQARAAAINYINVAPPGFQIAIVKFGSKVSFINFCPNAPKTCEFTNDRRRLRDSIDLLQKTMGRTALQEGIGTGLDLLHGKVGRREVVAFTDGYENSQTEGPYKDVPGLNYVIQRALREEATITTIGLGREINENYLKQYEQTHGEYLYAPTPAKLATMFGIAARRLGSERKVEYDTKASNPDGTRGKILPVLTIGKTELPGEPSTYVRPGLLPHVRGTHFWFIILIAVLSVLPSGFSLLSSLYVVWRFRARHVRQLEAGSAYLNKRDPNYDPSRGSFKIGDLIVLCPASNTPYYVRSWRMCKCQCGREPLCAGNFCYHRVLPKWLRVTLDRLFKNSEGKAGRTWLCHCAGDKFGY